MSLFIAGHQPDLFHPGVWLKNFALNSLAKRHGALPLNLVIDNDTVKSTTVRVPILGRRDQPQSVHSIAVPFDHFAGEVPFEERAVLDEVLFADFPRAVAERTADWPFTPFLPAFWQELPPPPAHLGDRLAAGRRTWERRWGCDNPELPISRLCRTAAFAQFAMALLADLPAFHAAYNACVHEYRRSHRIRSNNHPVPDLLRDGEWLEAPFWAWPVGGRRRGQLFVRGVAGGWELRVGGKRWPDLPRSGTVEHWRRLESDGFKVRTRALTTTLFARLCLADLFIHGIGGGKYDELTDAIIARHFGIQPPGFLVLTGTLRLPLPTYPATADDERTTRRLVRDIHWNPQRHLPPDAEDWQDMVDAKMELASATNVNAPHARYLEMRRLTNRIHERVTDIEADARRHADRVSAEVAANAILRRRDYAFCLFPDASLRPFLQRFQASVLA